MMQADEPSKSVLVQCRTSGQGWLLLFAVSLIPDLIGGMGLWAAWNSPPQNLQDWETGITLFLIFALIFGAPLGALALYLARRQIVADAAGVSWRGLGRWKYVTWTEITDYDIKTIRTANGDSVSFIAEAGMQRLRFDSSWTNTPALRDCIQQHATAAKAKSWSERQERPEDWPQTFGYNTKYRNVPRFLVQWHIGTVAIVVVWFAGQWVMTHTLPGWGWLLTPTGLFVIAKEAILAGLHPAAAATHRRLHERIELTEQGLRWDDGTRQVTAAWEEVTDYYTIGGPLTRSVVVTAHETFDFLWTLRDNERLRWLIQKYAVNAGQVGWRTTVALERTVRDRRGQTRTQRVYHYRTDATFMGLFLGIVLSAFVVGVSVSPLLQALRQSPTGGTIGLAVLLILLLLCLMWGLVQCLTISVRTDAEGITRRGLFGSQFIPWEQVQDFYWAGGWGMDIGVVVGPYTRIRFWDSLTDSEKLLEEITERAVNSRSRAADAEEGARA